MKKKLTVLSILCALMALLMIGGTIAYLTSQDSVSNTFTVGKVQITLDETDTDEYGNPIPDAERVKGNEYKLIPGRTYVKDPTVTVLKGSEPCYVRVKLTIYAFDTVVEALERCGATPQWDGLDGFYGAGWENTSNAEGTVAGTYVRYFEYEDSVDAREAAQTLNPVFSNFKFHEKFEGVDIEALKAAGFKLVLEAQAIQADGFADAAAAWAAFPQA